MPSSSTNISWQQSLTTCTPACLAPSSTTPTKRGERTSYARGPSPSGPLSTRGGVSFSIRCSAPTSTTRWRCSRWPLSGTSSSGRATTAGGTRACDPRTRFTWGMDSCWRWGTSCRPRSTHSTGSWAPKRESEYPELLILFSLLIVVTDKHSKIG